MAGAETPRDPVVLADDDAGSGRHAKSGDVERAGLGDHAAMQTDLGKTDGMAVAKCGSLDKTALPVSVREPATAQELEPVPAATAPEPKTCGMIWSILAALCRTLVALRS